MVHDTGIVGRPLLRPGPAGGHRRPRVSLGRGSVRARHVFARGLRGTGVSEGWSFEPAARAAYGDSEKKKIVPYIEWYSEMGSIPDLTPVARQAHQIFSGVDLKLARHLIWSIAPGVGLTPTEPRLVFKSHLEFEFGRNNN